MGMNSVMNLTWYEIHV